MIFLFLLISYFFYSSTVFSDPITVIDLNNITNSENENISTDLIISDEELFLDENKQSEEELEEE